MRAPRLPAWLALLVLVAVCACGSSASGAAIGRPSAPTSATAGPEQIASPSPSATPLATTLVNLQSLEDLKQRFNSDQGTPRLVLLLSPT